MPAYGTELTEAARHMRQLGLGALAHAIWHATHWSEENGWWSELSVLQAAHAAEILIKARIAEEHPLLIFDQLPQPSRSDPAGLTFDRLIESGRTAQFSELPDRLWATTGVQLPEADRFRRFGKLRNAIQHFAVPAGLDASTEVLSFLFAVVDPFIHACWGLYAIDYNEAIDSMEEAVYPLIQRRILFLVSPDAATELRDFDASSCDSYVIEMRRRAGSLQKP